MLRNLSLLLLIAALDTSWAAERVVGYRGDRNGYFAGATPPTTWNGQTGENIRWKTELPNWCWGTPMVVGNKIFVMSESGWKSDWPELVCLDLKSGSILWQRPINHLPIAIPDEQERKRYEAAWASYHARWRKAFPHNRKINEAREAGDDALHKKLIEEAVALGWVKKERLAEKKLWKMQARNADRAGSIFNLQVGVDPDLGITTKDMSAKYDLRHENFYGAATARIGEAFPTPASDGEYVYVSTGYGSHACFDLDGNQRWIQWFRSGGAKHYDSIGRSPLVIDGLMISDTFAQASLATVRAFDCKTGKLVWESPVKTGNGPGEGGSNGTVGSSKAIELGGVRYLVMRSGHIIRLSDGKQYLASFVKRYGTHQSEIGIIDELDMLITNKSKGQHAGGAYGVKLTIDGDTIKDETVWELPQVKCKWVFAIEGTNVYTGTGVIDAQTGSFTPWGDSRSVSAPSTRWLLAVADGKIYGCSEAKRTSKGVEQGWGVSAVIDVTTGKNIARNALPTPTLEDLPSHLKERRLATTGGYGNRFSYSAPFMMVDDMILVRSMDHLWCIGEK